MSLLDAVVEKEIPCKIPKCKNTWTLKAEELVASWKDPNYHLPRRMCDSCKKIFDETSPLEVKCSTLDCEEKIIIDPYQQLILRKKEKFLKHETQFCPSCKELLKTVTDKEIPCSMKACKNTWSWYASSQLRSGGKSLKAQPESRLCKSCYDLLKTLKNQSIPCKIKGCTEEWTLDKMTQLEWSLTRRKERKRMCASCSSQLKALKPRKIPCRVSGCPHTWTWASFSQLEFEIKQRQDPALTPPQRYCKFCFSHMHTLKSSQIPCPTQGCTSKIDYPVENQLEDIVNKRKHNFCGICPSCTTNQRKLKPKPMPCKEEGCEQTWIWTPEEQFNSGHYQDGKFIVGTPKERYCDHCHLFMDTHKDTHVNCQQCGAPILWTVHQQLKTEIGQWVSPKYCPSCLKKGLPSPSKTEETL
ncbi:hypothetical protein WDW89_05515 [Deltaproteobacteria bacterium TL4]